METPVALDASSGTARGSRADDVADEIERRIVNEDLLAGQRIGTKEELHAAFGVGIGTVNVAVRLLKSRGLVELKPGPGGGVFVAGRAARVRLSNQRLGLGAEHSSCADWLAVQEALEPLVDREAARHRADADVEELRAILARMRERLDRPAELLDLSWRLRRREARICRNVTLRALYLTLLDHTREAFAQVQRRSDFEPRHRLEADTRLVDAIAAGERR